MKKSLILITIALFSSISFANDNFKNVVLVSSENKNIVLEFYGLEKINTSLSITDQSNVILFQETEKTPGLLKNKFSLNKLKGDTFVVHLENKYKSIKTTYKFDKSKNKAIAQGNPIEVFKPIYKQNEKKVTVYLLNSFQKKVTIEVLDIHGNALVPKLITTKPVINQMYDFSPFTSTARIRIKNGQSFIKEFAF